MHRITAWRHYKAGTLPPELQPKRTGNIVCVLANPEATAGRTVGYSRVSSDEQKLHLENQANRLWAYAGQNSILFDTLSPPRDLHTPCLPKIQASPNLQL